MSEYPQLVLLLSAELMFVLIRSPDIRVVLKSQAQRTRLEQHEIDRGLMRSIVLEAILFVPASAILVILLAPVLIPKTILPGDTPIDVVYAALGIGSYGFPFATFRRVITRLALNTLREFASLVPAEARSEIETDEGNRP